MYKDNQPLVSVVMPAYNSENFIEHAINSVLNQSYKNWELYIIDDCSDDKTSKIAKKFSINDNRIRYFKLNKNSGAAIARNKGIDFSSGKYIAFLDSDDTWYQNKLKIQVTFMEENDIQFSCTDYEKINENGEKTNRIVKSKPEINYKGVLKNCPGNSTVIYNSKQLGKYYISNIRKRNDYLMWLQISKRTNLIGINKVLSTHRIQKNGISNNKFSLVKYHWKVYRKYESINVWHSIYLIFYWITKPLWMHLKD